MNSQRDYIYERIGLRDTSHPGKHLQANGIAPLLLILGA